jgi:phytoene dehydrogenase-like protein
MARLVVLGAGAAGLTAARALIKAGHSVIVLEARDVIGGRARTSTITVDGHQGMTQRILQAMM